MKLRGDCELSSHRTVSAIHMSFQQTCTQWVDASAVRQPDATRKPWCVWVTEHKTQATHWIPSLKYERAQQINGALVEGHQAGPTLKAM